MSVQIDKAAMRERLLTMLDSYIAEAKEHEDESTFDPAKDLLEERLEDFILYWATHYGIA